MKNKVHSSNFSIIYPFFLLTKILPKIKTNFFIILLSFYFYIN